MIVVICLTFYLFYPNKFAPQEIAIFLREFHGSIWLVYLAMSALRGITLLPSTPLVIAGAIIFPDQLFWVFVVSITGITLSSTMIYYFSEFLGFDEFFENKNPALSEKLKRNLERPLGFLFVAGWAFFPIVPTDLVCYLAGTIRMSFIKFIAAILVGESILCYFYIFLGGSLINKLW